MRTGVASMVLALAAAAAAQVPQDSVGRELAIRRWALRPEACRQGLLSALADPSWESRAAALEALARSARAGVRAAGSEDLQRAADGCLASASRLVDVHPNVLVGWLEAAGAAARFEAIERRLEGVDAGALVSPAARAALLRLVPASVALARAAQPLVADPDPALAALARVRLEPLELVAAGGKAPEALEAALGIERDVGWRGKGVLGARARNGGADAPVLLAALALELDGALEPASLERGWTSLAASSRRARALLSRAATRGGEELAQTFLARAAGDPDGDPDRDPEAWVDAVLFAVGPERALELARQEALPARVATALLEAAGSSVESFQAAALEPWLARDVAPAIRRAAAELAARRLIVQGDVAAGDVLARRLGDADPELAALARRFLLSADDAGRWQAELHALWLARDAAGRRDLLSRLPRHVRWDAFREDFLSLGRTRRDLRGPLAELLAAFRGDREVEQALEGWLQLEVADIGRAAAGGADPGPAIARGRSLVLSLAQVEPDASAALEHAAEGTARLEAARDVVKEALAALARTESGRQRLARFVGDEDILPRARIEAALGLAPAGDDSAAAYLIERFPSCDGDLRGRILAAFAWREDERTRDFLVQIATSPEAAPVDRSVAAASLGSRTDPESTQALETVLVRARDLDVVHAAVRALGERTDEDSRALLRALLDLATGGRRAAGRDLLAGAGGPDTAFGPGELWSTLLEAIAARGSIGEREVAAVWRRPLESVAPDLRARFRGKRLAKTRFRFRGELALAAAATQAGVKDLLVPGWEGTDARFLLALSEVVEHAGGESAAALAEGLARGAIVGLLGEAPGRERDEALLAARLARLRLAERLGRWRDYASAVTALRLDRQRNELPSEAFERALGTFDARRGIDPLGRLAQAAPTARGLAALFDRDLTEARRELAAGRAVCSFSRTGTEALDELERAIETAQR